MFITSAAAFVWANLNPTNYIGSVSFCPERDIPDLAGKVVLVTGGNTGLGKETIRQIIKHNPEQVFLAARSEEKAQNAIRELESTAPNIKITWLPLDLASTKSIHDAAETFRAHASRLDILILNAGVMSLPPGETDLGHEIQLGTNHTGHFLLTKLLLPVLLETAQKPDSDVRVISLSSIGHNLAPDFETILHQDELKKCNTNARYGASKAANIIFAAELARRYPSLTAVSVHPGIIVTELYAATSASNPIAALAVKLLGLIATKVEQGAWNQLWAAVGAKKGELVNGAYYTPVGIVKQRNRYVVDQKMGRRLWEWTETELKRDHKEGFIERMLQPHPHHQRRRSSVGEGEIEKPDLAIGLERQSSTERNEQGQNQAESGGQNVLRPQRRNSRLQRLKEFMHSEEELDDAGKTYAKLM
ncbi:uncharacterized protein ANIA_08603 [Aspergillus nidulans FGSC A4]|uniref:Uncharacterized protein n=1 Tax=Emericella nidulans (strain FGSC A4 / ATCC 38163 / CBS 112.46 / NRRL 194 / M139) TaxID=227321 RepID=C8VAG8_EMENI|nr:hypothetical protein [Aspergillus nidulans FGSC A4]CBF78350.1 TPA: conserved hypothetical protein [Aspergillus nidulans FGSC A4]